MDEAKRKYHREYMKKYRALHPELGIKYRTKNKEKLSQQGKEYFQKTKESKAQQRKQVKANWYEQNKESLREKGRQYHKLFPEKGYAREARRRATKLQAVPKWVDKEELFLIREVYRLAKLRTKLTGISWHVDHIIPLKGKTVCGLHTIANLQVIPAIVNIKKSNLLLSD